MDTVKSAIEIAGKKIHPETSADCVKYNNTNANTFMEGVLSSANLSTAIQTLLKSKNYSEACRALKVAPETFFDESFNVWEAYGAPTVSNGSLILNGSSAITTANKFPLTGDFCAQISFTTGSSFSTEQSVVFIFASSALFFNFRITTAQVIGLHVRLNSSTNKNLTLGNAAANSFYRVEFDYDSQNKMVYAFLNGSLADSQSITYSGGNHQVRLSGNYSSPPGVLFTGQVHEFRLSDCVRHTTSHTASDSDYFSYDDNTISLLHFD